MKKISFVLCVVLGLLFAIPAMGQSNKTLREQVREQGHVLIGGGGDPLTEEQYNTLPDLISKSKFVIKGRIAGVKPRLSKDETGIWTDFRVQVLEVVRNSTSSEVPNFLTMTLGGGKIKFPEGTAEVVDGNYPYSSHPILGQIYILFLATSDEDSSKYRPIEGAEGVFRIVNDKSVPATLQGHPLSKKYLGKDSASFIAEIKETKGREGQK